VWRYGCVKVPVEIVWLLLNRGSCGLRVALAFQCTIGSARSSGPIVLLILRDATLWSEARLLPSTTGKLPNAWRTGTWAREQGICVSLISAAGKEGFYKYHGVTEEVGMASEGGDENPLRLVDGGMILFSKGIPKAIE
jgi:hypothetical protein